MLLLLLLLLLLLRVPTALSTRLILPALWIRIMPASIRIIPA